MLPSLALRFSHTSTIYFSFVTLATLGHGDIRAGAES
jgi:hypothetical protein